MPRKSVGSRAANLSNEKPVNLKANEVKKLIHEEVERLTLAHKLEITALRNDFAELKKPRIHLY